MIKIFPYFVLFLFVSGCITGSIDYNTQEITNSASLKSTKSWIVQYDTLNSRIITTDFLGGSTVTKYPDSMGMEDFLEEPYQIAEKRGRELAENIRSELSSKVSASGEGIIRIERPFYKDKFHFHCTIAFYDKSNNKIAAIDIYNKCQFDGRFTNLTVDAMHDHAFAKFCAAKINSLIGS